MKILNTVVFVVAIALSLAGCEKKDYEYYSKNLDAAEAKREECSNGISKAQLEGDRKAYDKLINDEQCIAAKNAIINDKKLKAQLEREREEAEKQQALDAAKTIIVKETEGLTWQQTINEYLKDDECQEFTFGTSSAKCQAWKIIYDEKAQEGKDQLKQLSFDEIKGEMLSLCKLDSRTKSNCRVAEQALEEKAATELANDDLKTIEEKESIYCSDDLRFSSVCRSSWQKAWAKQNQEVVKFFVDNQAEFISTYNACVDKVVAIDSTVDDWSKRIELNQNIKDSYPCSQIREAAIKRGMSYTNFKEKISN